MAFVFDATVGGVAANSYVAVAAADDYCGGRLNASAWTALSTADRERALASATARLEQESYVGAPVTTTQRLLWPRYGVSTPDGFLYPSTAIPRPVQEATFELALHFANAGSTDTLAPTGLEAFDAISVGPVSLDIRRDTPPPGALPPQVVRLLRRLLTSTPGVTRLVRA